MNKTWAAAKVGDGAWMTRRKGSLQEAVEDAQAKIKLNITDEYVITEVVCTVKAATPPIIVTPVR